MERSFYWHTQWNSIDFHNAHMVPNDPPGIGTTVTVGTIARKPKISAYSHLYRPHNYIMLSFLPIVMEELIHEKPTCRKTFAEH